VLNRPELVAERTRERVQGAVEQLDYVLNGSARNLRTGRSSFVGLVVLDVTNPFFTEVARGTEDAANESGYAIVLCNSDNSEGKERPYLRMLEEQRARGLIITPVARDAGRLSWLRKRGMGVVLLDRPSTDPDLCSVAVDDVGGGALAGRHLLERGHERLCLLTGSLSIQQCAERREGMRNAVAAAGLDPDEAIYEVEVPTLGAESGEAVMERILDRRRPPTAVFCVSDRLAMGFMRAVTARGMSVPDDVALVGYDDVEFAAVLRTSLTTVRQPKYQLGEAAMRLMLDEVSMSDAHHHQQLLFRPELVVRASTGSHG
jgi:LacI family transcriptional regulator